MPLETMIEAMERLEASGYVARWKAIGSSLMAGTVGGEPGEFSTDETVRFEGETDPADEAALFALTHTPSGTKGLYVITYGPDISPDDADVVSHLS